MALWGSGIASKISIYFEGLTIIDKLKKSIYGKIKKTFTEICGKESEREYKLPRVIVIGNESTGKSSVLERIIKCQLFPKHNKLCTKTPLRLVIENGPSKYTVSYNNEAIGYKNVVKEFEDKYDIYNFVNEIMNKLDLDNISKEEIIINIRDEDMPNFEFIDLPGIRTYPESAAKTTQELCRSYLEDKNSIVICVVPSTITRLTSCQSIGIIRELNMERNCILALTMVDRLQPQDIEDLLVKRILGQSDEMPNLNFAGYVAIVNRVHTNILTLDESDKSEDLWFKKNILENIPAEYDSYKELLENNMTLNNLLEKMDILYGKFINTEWKPKIIKEIELKIDNYSKLLDELGPEKIDETIFRDILDAELTKVRVELLSDDKECDDFDDDDLKGFLLQSHDPDQLKFEVEKCNYRIMTSRHILNYMIRERLQLDNFIQVVNIIFTDKTPLKLNRFVKLKAFLLGYINELYDKMVDTHVINTLLNSIEYYYNGLFLQGIKPPVNLTQKCFMLYTLYVVRRYIDNFRPEFSKELFEEDIEWSEQRKTILSKLSNARIHHDQITNLSG
jgi:GTP-binding protein EngB required for normal cell division